MLSGESKGGQMKYKEVRSTRHNSPQNNYYYLHF